MNQTTSITLPSWRSPPGVLRTFDAGETRNELIEAIYSTRLVKWAVFGLDISMNDDTNKGFDLGWQIQYYGFAKVEDRRTFSHVLRQSLRGDSRVSRPVVVKSCDGADRALSYAFKPDSIRRISYWGTGKTHTGKPRKCWRTRKVSLKAREEVELRLWLHQIGLSKRVSLFGLKVVRTRYGLQLNLKQLE